MKKLLLLAIFLAPLGAKILNFNFVGGFQMSPFRMIIILALLGLLLNSLRDKELHLYNKKNKYSVIFMIFWLVVAIMSGLWALDMRNYIRNLFFIFIGIATIILFVSYFKTINDFKQAFKALTLGIFVQTIIGWYEIFTRNYYFLDATIVDVSKYQIAQNRIPIAMMGNPNDFATLMLVGVFVTLICAELSKRGFAKIIYYAMSANCIILLLMTTSRANILGLFIAVAFLFVFSKLKTKFFILIVLIGVVLTPTIIELLSTEMHFDFSSGSDSTRWNLIKNGFVFLEDTWGFGVGAGQIESWMEDRAIYNTAGITNMHNWWMECLVGYGVIVFVGYLIFYCSLFKDFFKSSRKNVNKQEETISKQLCAIMLGFTIACVSSSSNLTSEWLWIFWAICVAYQGIITNNKCGLQYVGNEV